MRNEDDWRISAADIETRMRRARVRMLWNEAVQAMRRLVAVIGRFQRAARVFPSGRARESRK